MLSRDWWQAAAAVRWAQKVHARLKQVAEAASTLFLFEQKCRFFVRKQSTSGASKANLWSPVVFVLPRFGSSGLVKSRAAKCLEPAAQELVVLFGTFFLGPFSFIT